jgi:class 3 adenylate cyclase
MTWNDHPTVTELPTGTVTLLFTDIEGSTRLLQSLQDQYGRVLGDHRAILRQVFSRHGGLEFGTEGDASFAVFRSPGPALMAAAAIQEGLAGVAWPGGADVRVRIGVHTGTPTVVDGDYVGLDVHRVARICSAGHGGQVLVSETTRSMTGEDDLAGLGFRDLGYHRLKDLDRPQRLYQLTGPGLRQAFPPVRSLPPASNLPSAPTSFVGRERELGEVRAMLQDPAVRLLTLVGPGGTGKTRLALEAAGGSWGASRTVCSSSRSPPSRDPSRSAWPWWTPSGSPTPRAARLASWWPSISATGACCSWTTSNTLPAPPDGSTSCSAAPPVPRRW